MDNAKSMAKGLQRAASLLGKRSWEARLKRYGRRKLMQLMSVASKAAKRSGRPRLPDDQVKPNTLYQRERRKLLKAQTKRTIERRATNMSLFKRNKGTGWTTL